MKAGVGFRVIGFWGGTFAGSRDRRQLLLGAKSAWRRWTK